MVNILYPPPRPQSVGEILDLSFRIFGATLLKCLPYAIVGVVIGHIPTMYDLARGRPLVATQLGMQQMLNGRWLLLFLVASLGTVFISNAILLRQYALATGHPAAVGTELAAALRKLPGIVLIGILIALAIFVSFIPVGIVAAIVVGVGMAASGAAKAGASAAAIWAAVIYVGLVFVCASWAVVRWICSGPAYLLTERGPVASMGYSWELTRGSFWRLSAIYTVGVVLIVVLYVLSTVIGGIVVALVARGDVAVITAVTALVISLLGAFVTPYYSALILAVFGDASVRRQGVDLEQRIAAPTPT